MATIHGTNSRIDLGAGYALRAPGLHGEANQFAPSTALTRASVRRMDAGLDALDDALRRSQVTEARLIDVDALPLPGAAAIAPLRSARGEPQLELEVPDFGDDQGLLVLSIDAAGALRWHAPLPRPATPTGVSRGGGGTRRFLIPAGPPPAAASGTPATRGVIGSLGRRLLKVLVYPITDPIFGALGEAVVEHWEARKRPYGLRSFTPANFRDPNGPALSLQDLRAMRDAGPALLFVHGTFSTAHAAFGDLSDATFAALHQRYNGRVFAFNHPTLGHTPQRNVEWLMEQLPSPGSAGAWPVDIVCHSRGGLVSRALAEQPSAFGLDTSRLHVRRVVMAAVPNAGTLLAHPDHMAHLLDRLTTALTLVAHGPVAEWLEAIITAVKVVGHGVLGRLDGLQSMKPDGPFIRQLNVAGQPTPEYFAVSADYEPTDAGLRGLVRRLADAALDVVFEQAGNDLVVPSLGVYDGNGGTGFPVPDARLVKLGASEGVMHTTVFGHAGVQQRLLQWLTP